MLAMMRVGSRGACVPDSRGKDATASKVPPAPARSPHQEITTATNRTSLASSFRRACARRAVAIRCSIWRSRRCGRTRRSLCSPCSTPRATRPRASRADKVAVGVWFLAGGSHNSVLLEMSEHLVLVETSLGDARTRAVIEQGKALAPAKPIRYAVNSHAHFDHAGRACWPYPTRCGPIAWRRPASPRAFRPCRATRARFPTARARSSREHRAPATAGRSHPAAARPRRARAELYTVAGRTAPAR